MRGIAKSWDFLFGVLLIGGVPWAILALTIIVEKAVQGLFNITVSDGAGMAIMGVALLAALIGCGGALMFRLRHRRLPIGFVFFEALLGLVGAVALLIFYGVLMYSVVG